MNSVTKKQILAVSLTDLYGSDEQILNYQKKRYSKLLQNFKNIFKVKPEKYFSTPGRTEISGNHTDHNHGLVIAASINLDSVACVSKTDKVVTIISEGFKEPFIVSLENLTQVESESGTTNSLVRGIASRFFEKGFKVGGFNACITSDVLQGSGLSSSASIEVLIGTIFNHLYNNGVIPPLEIAKIGQYAENDFFKKPCGLMDQLACAVGGIIEINFRNPESPAFHKIEFEFASENYSLVFVHTGGSHINLTNDYAAIPDEMKSVAAELGGKFLREVDYDQFKKNISTLRNKTSDRAILRTHHFFKENDRVKKQVEALKSNDFTKYLSLVNESGNSSFKYLQNIYSSSDPNYQPLSVALAITEEFINQKGQGACRVHGGGFEGTIQVYINNNLVDEYVKYISGISDNFKILNLSVRQIGTTEVIVH